MDRIIDTVQVLEHLQPRRWSGLFTISYVLLQTSERSRTREKGAGLPCSHFMTCMFFPSFGHIFLSSLSQSWRSLFTSSHTRFKLDLTFLGLQEFSFLLLPIFTTLLVSTLGVFGTPYTLHPCTTTTSSPVLSPSPYPYVCTDRTILRGFFGIRVAWYMGYFSEFFLYRFVLLRVKDTCQGEL